MYLWINSYGCKDTFRAITIDQNVLIIIHISINKPILSIKCNNFVIKVDEELAKKKIIIFMMLLFIYYVFLLVQPLRHFKGSSEIRVNNSVGTFTDVQTHSELMLRQQVLCSNI